MTDVSSSLLLKLLSGPHIGAEVDLVPGEYVLGSDEECDLLLHDGSIAPRHLQLSIGEQGLFLKPLEGQVWINGIPVSAGQAMEPYQIITLGTTHLALGRQGNWPHLPLPTLQQPEAAPDTPDDDHDPEDGPSDSAASLPEQSPPPRRRPSLLLPILTVLLLASGLGYLAWPQGGRHIPVTVSPLNQIRELVNAQNIPGLSLSDRDDGTIVVQGYVDTTAERRRLENALQQVDQQVRSEVTAGEDLVRAVTTTLNALDLPLEVRYQGLGAVLVSGYTDQAARWQQAQQVMRRDISDLGEIHGDIATPRSRYDSLRQELSDSSLAEAVQLGLTTDGILADGEVAAPDWSRWQQVVKRYQSRYQNQPPLLDNVRPAGQASPATVATAALGGEVTTSSGSNSGRDSGSNSNATLPPLQIHLRSIGLQPVPYVITQDGRKFLQGARLGNGYIIKDIHADRLILWHNNRETVYHFDNLSGNSS